jgi:hypothetical protein
LRCVLRAARLRCMGATLVLSKGLSYCSIPSAAALTVMT